MKLEDVIFVTNQVGMPIPSQPIAVVYHVTVHDDELEAFKQAVVQCWQDNFPIYYADKYHLGRPACAVAGPMRGIIRVDPNAKINYKPMNLADRDALLLIGINPIRFFPGHGFLLEGAEIHRYGKHVTTAYRSGLSPDDYARAKALTSATWEAMIWAGVEEPLIFRPPQPTLLSIDIGVPKPKKYEPDEAKQDIMEITRSFISKL